MNNRLMRKERRLLKEKATRLRDRGRGVVGWECVKNKPAEVVALENKIVKDR